MADLIMDYSDILQAYGYEKTDLYISRMFIRNNESYKKSATYHYKLTDLIQELNTCHKDDLYISMNDFMAPSRKEENVHRLKHLYVDLDTYHSEYADLPYCNEQILAILEENYFGKKFPIPSLIISSGRGLYLIWNINEHKNALPRWKTVQKYLCSLLKEFGADPKVSTDSARVLRVPGSINTKSGQTVTILQKNNEKHSLYEFLDLYMPDSYMQGIRAHEQIRKEKQQNKEKSRRVNTKKEEVNAKLECKIAKYHSQLTLMEARLSDLETLLLNFRDQKHGSKEYIFFLYRMWALNLYKDTKLVNEKILSLNAKLKNKANPDRLLAETRSAETYFQDKKIRNMKNETIISFLSITEEEMKSLKTIISVKEAKERKAIRNKCAYDAKLERNNDIRKQEKILLRYEKIHAYLENGYTAKQISELLGQSYRQTLRDIKELKEIDYIGQNTENLESNTNTVINETNNNKDNYNFTISSTGSYSIHVTKIKPYLLQDVVHSSIHLQQLYWTSYEIQGYIQEGSYYDTDSLSNYKNRGKPDDL